MFKNDRYNNAGLWISIFALLGLLLKDFGIYPENFSAYIEIILSILVCLGIISNPKDGNWYNDKDKE